MSAKRALLVVLAASAVMLAAGIGPRSVHTAQALPPGPAGATIPYPGQLTDEAGQPVADGAYSFTFALYDAESGGEPLWSETQEGVAVQGGVFTALLGSVNAIPKEVLEDARWLAVGVRGPGEAAFTALAPRQRVSAASDSTSAGPACAHDHWGESWNGTGTTTGLHVGSQGGYALEGLSSGNIGVLGVSTSGMFFVPSGMHGVYGIGDASGVFGSGLTGVRGVSSGAGDGVVGESSGDYWCGVRGSNSDSGWGFWHFGVCGQATGSTGYNVGVRGSSNSPDGWGGQFSNNGGGTGLYVYGYGAGAEYAALKAYSFGSNGVAAYFVNQSGYPTLELDQSGSGRVLDLQTFGAGDFIAGYGSDVSSPRFKITNNGSMYNDTGVYSSPADFAEMLPAVEGLQPGDVLVIGSDGTLTRSTEPYQASVAGVYSTQPGFVGGHPVNGAIPGTIPLAIVGVVPVKVSAENGPIRPGDLLVASSTPGYAMRAGPNPPQGTVIGKALEKLDEGVGVIKMLATLQ